MEKSSNKIWRKWWFWVLVIFIIMVLLSGGRNTENEETNQDTNEIENVNVNSNEEVKENEYAKDNIVNKFFKDFKTTSNYELTDIKEGNIKTKYFAYINGQYCEFINATENVANYFQITIYGGNNSEDINKIVDVSKEVIKALDQSISESYINDAVEHLKNTSTSYNITENIKVNLYPIVELSYGKSDCRIEIITTIYN